MQFDINIFEYAAIFLTSDNLFSEDKVWHIEILHEEFSVKSTVG